MLQATKGQEIAQRNVKIEELEAQKQQLQNQMAQQEAQMVHIQNELAEMETKDYWQGY